MAAFVSLATCHHCNLSSRHGLVYRDSLSALSRRFMTPRAASIHSPLVRTLPLGARGTHTPQRPFAGAKPHSRTPRPNIPESIALASSKPPNMKHFVFAHLRRLLTLNHHRSRKDGSLKLLV